MVSERRTFDGMGWGDRGLGHAASGFRFCQLCLVIIHPRAAPCRTFAKIRCVRAFCLRTVPDAGHDDKIILWPSLPARVCPLSFPSPSISYIIIYRLRCSQWHSTVSTAVFDDTRPSQQPRQRHSRRTWPLVNNHFTHTPVHDRQRFRNRSPP